MIRTFYFLASASILGCILVVGKLIILPIVIAAMLSYVLVGATETLGRLPVLRSLPKWLLYVCALTIFGVAMVMIVLVAIANVRNIAQNSPNYQKNIVELVRVGSNVLGLEDAAPTWDTLRSMTLDRIDLTQFSFRVLSSLLSVGGYLVLVVTYVIFLLAERAPFSNKLDQLLENRDDRSVARDVFTRINQQVVTYLSSKTLVNVILGATSYVAMVAIGIDNAVFWAFLIALLNYIPYVGSFGAVALVTAYTLVATASVPLTVLMLICLTILQIVIGNFAEPRIMSRSLNLSPFVVLLSLVVWSSLWGLIGAIIAVPMTSIMMLILGAFPSTRFVPLLLSRDGRIYGAQ